MKLRSREVVSELGGVPRRALLRWWADDAGEWKGPKLDIISAHEAVRKVKRAAEWTHRRCGIDEIPIDMGKRGLHLPLASEIKARPATFRPPEPRVRNLYPQVVRSASEGAIRG